MTLFRLVLLVVCIQSQIMAATIVVDFEELTQFTAESEAGGGRYFDGNDGTGTTNSNGWTSGGVLVGS